MIGIINNISISISISISVSVSLQELNELGTAFMVGFNSFLCGVCFGTAIYLYENHHGSLDDNLWGLVD